MIPIKTQDEIKRMKEGGKRLARVMREVLDQVKPGVKLSKLDRLAESLIEKAGGKPSFKIVPSYHWATCINVDQGVVHGVPDDYQVKAGDLVSVDIGIFYKGLHTDMARTIKVQSSNDKFLGVGRRALRQAVRATRTGNRVGHISKVIEEEIKKTGLSPIRTLTGHGVGKELHEEPQIPCFLEGVIEQTAILKLGMTLAVEVIYAQGKPDLILDDDGWTLKTADGSLAGLFEDTIAVTKKGPLILTG